MNRTGKRFLSTLLVAIMLIGMLPAVHPHAHAAEVTTYEVGATVTTKTEDAPAKVGDFVWVSNESTLFNPNPTTTCGHIEHTHSDDCYTKSCDHEDGHVNTCYPSSTAYSECTHSDASEHTGSVTITDVVTYEVTYEKNFLGLSAPSKIDIKWKEHPATETVKTAFVAAGGNGNLLKKIAAMATIYDTPFCYTTTAGEEPTCGHVCSEVGGSCYSISTTTGCVGYEHAHDDSETGCYEYRWTLTCLHETGTATLAEDATCTEAGTNGYWTCGTCGMVFTDASHTTETTVADQAIAPIGHTPAETAVQENVKNNGCGNDGSYDSVVYCARENCTYVYSRETVTVPATGEHTYTNETERVSATCTKDGYVIMACSCDATQRTTLPAIDHDYGGWQGNGENTHIRICQNNSAHTETKECDGFLCSVCGALNAEDGKIGINGADKLTGLKNIVLTAAGLPDDSDATVYSVYMVVGQIVGEGTREIDVETTSLVDQTSMSLRLNIGDSQPFVIKHTSGVSKTVTMTVGETRQPAVIGDLTYTTTGFNTEKQFKDAVEAAIKANITDAEYNAIDPTVIFAYEVNEDGTYNITTTVWEGSTWLTAERTFEKVAWTVNTYTVKFVDENDTVLQSSEVAYGEIPVAPADPTKAADAQNSYKFAGWDNDLTDEGVSGIDAVDGQTTYTAVFTATEHAVVIDEAVAATCTQTGLTEGSHCSVCGHVIVAQSVVEAQGHKPAEAVMENVNAAGCGNGGSYESVVYCSVEGCKVELSRETVTVPATSNHNYLTEQERKDATCTEEGYVVMACSCGATETTTLEKIAHTPDEAVTENNVAPTCTVGGSYDTVVYCSDCKVQLSRETTAVDAIGHKYVYTEIDGLTHTVGCENCDLNETEGHAFGTDHKCADCGASVSFVLNDNRVLNYYDGMANVTNEDVYDAVVKAPAYDSDVVIQYKAREAMTHKVSVNAIIPAGTPGWLASMLKATLGDTVDFAMPELWLDVNVADGELNEEIKNAVSLEDAVVANLTTEKISEIIKNPASAQEKLNEIKDNVYAAAMYYGAHTFGYNATAAETVTEAIKVSHETYGIETETTVTLKDTRAVSYVKGEDVQIMYKDYTDEELAGLLLVYVADEAGNKISTAVTCSSIVDPYTFEGKNVSDTAYELTFKFAGNEKYKPSEATFTVTVTKAPAELDLPDVNVTYGTAYDPIGDAAVTLGNKYGEESEITDSLIRFLIGLDISEIDVNKDGVYGLNGQVQLILPVALQSVLDKALGLTGADTSDGMDMTLTELQNYLKAIDDGSLAVLTQTLETISGITEKGDDLTITIGGSYPANIGAYLYGAVSTNSNYETAYDVAYIVIEPKATQVYLDWNDHDENAVFTWELLKSFDFEASAYNEKTFETLNEAATEQTHELFFGINDDGEFVAELDKITTNGKNLGIGAFVEIAFIAEFGNEFYYAVPAVRPIVIVPNVVTIKFDDQNENDMFLREFNNAAQVVSATVYGVDGEELTDGTLTITYTGLQTNGKPYEPTTEAPVHAGTYLVTATYTRATDGETTEVGLNTAVLVIKPTKSEIVVNNELVKYNGENVSITEALEIEASSKASNVTVDTTVITAAIKNTDTSSVNLLTAIDGEVNVDLPKWVDELIAEYDLLSYKLPVEDFVAAIEKVETKAAELAAAAEVEIDLAAFDKLIEVIEQLPEKTVLTFNDAPAYKEVGVYLVVGVVTDSDHYPAADAGVLVIYPNVDVVDLQFVNTDKNSIFTNDLLTGFDFSATASVNGSETAAADALMRHIVVGVGTDGTLVLNRVENEAVTTLMQGLPYGAYTQVVYLTRDGVEDDLIQYIGKPIARSIAHVPNTVDVNFEDMTVEYGEDYAIDVTVTKNGSPLVHAEGALTVYYAGITEGCEAYWSETAPTAVGKYAVIAVYVDGENVGAHAGTLVIEGKEVEPEPEPEPDEPDTPDEPDVPVIPDEPEAKTATINYETNGGSYIASETIDLNEKTTFTKPADPTKEGYVFVGWYCDPELNDEYSFDSIPDAGDDMTIYAKWEEKAEPEPEHKHSYHAVVTEPTCTAGGYTTYTCSCGDSYVDDEVGALGHTEGAAVIENELAPTCTTADSYDNVVYCTICSTELSRETIITGKALGHSWDDGEVTKQPTETETGEKICTCQVCGETKTVVVPELGHIHEYTAVVTEPTCTIRGYTMHTCACGDWYVTNEIGPKGHTEVVDAAVAATCTTTGLTEGKHCSVCNKVLVAQTVVGALGHTEAVDAAVAATCTATGLTEGKHCSVCSEVLVAQTVVDKLGHTEVVDAAKAPTVTTTGLTEGKHCSVCNTVLVAQEIVPATGRVSVEGETVYETLAAAVAAVKDGETITLIGDITGEANIVISKKITIFFDTAGFRCSANLIAGECYKRTASGSPNHEYLGVYVFTEDHAWGDWTQVDATNHKRVCSTNAEHVETAAHAYGDDSTCDACGYTQSSGGNSGGGTGGGSTGGSTGGGSAGGGGGANSGTSSPSVSTETTKNEDGSTTVTETKQDGTVVETTTNTDGSSTKTETKTETSTSWNGTTTTTTTTKTESTDASGNVVTEDTVEKTVEKKDGSAVTTTTTTTKDSSTGTTVTSNTVETTKVAADGSKVTTSTNETKSSDGSKSTTTVDANGKSETNVTVSATAVKNADKSDAAVTLPMPAVSATDESESAPVVEISVPAAARTVTVEIPVAEVSAGTVVVIVYEDGTEEVVKKTNLTEDGLEVKLDGSATVKVVENSKTFTDVKEDAWYADGVDFASSRELYNGVGDDKFDPNGDMTRGMLATVLHRLEDEMEQHYDGSYFDAQEGHWATEGIYWASENKIVEGYGDGNYGTNDNITREQMITMVYRYLCWLGVDTSVRGDLTEFNDCGKIHSWAEEAMQWAVGAGVINGVGNDLLDPDGSATRAQVAVFTQRVVALMF